LSGEAGGRAQPSTLQIAVVLPLFMRQFQSTLPPTKQGAADPMPVLTLIEVPPTQPSDPATMEIAVEVAAAMADAASAPHTSGAWEHADTVSALEAEPMGSGGSALEAEPMGSEGSAIPHPARRAPHTGRKIEERFIQLS
jgi:hypothetical protein